MIGKALIALGLCCAASVAYGDPVPTFAALCDHLVQLRPDLVGSHPRVFLTAPDLAVLRKRAQSTHRAEWLRSIERIRALPFAPPPPPGSQARRAHNEVALTLAELAFVSAVDPDPHRLEVAKRWLFAAIDYEPWGYLNNKPNVDLAAGHLLYAVALAYDLLFTQLLPLERQRVRSSLERHAQLVADRFSPGTGKRFAFTQNHNFIPTAGLGVAALALLGESPHASRWAALARAHQHRAGALLSPDGYFYEGFEYWIFSAPWLVLFLDAWQHSTGEDLWPGFMKNWKVYVSHSVQPDGQTVFDFGDAWQGALTRAKQGPEYLRAYPGGTLESNYNILFKIAARFDDPATHAVASRMAAFGHTSQHDFWSLHWRGTDAASTTKVSLPLQHHFEDSGVVFARTGWDPRATAVAFKAGPPQGHRVGALLATVPEARLDSGHAHPDAGSFMIYAGGKTLIADTGYAGRSRTVDHNSVTVGLTGQGTEGVHDVWRKLPYTARGLNGIRIGHASLSGSSKTIVADLAAAYDPSLGLTRFRRTFAFRFPDQFVISDDLAWSGAEPLQWHLHADSPFAKVGNQFVSTPDGGTASVRVKILTRNAVTEYRGRHEVLAPGGPGSIATGNPEARGYRLSFRVPTGKGRHNLRVQLRALTVRSP